MLYGVYEVLEDLFDYVRLSPEFTNYNVGVKSAGVPLYDQVVNPDIPQVFGGWGNVYTDDDREEATIMKMGLKSSDMFISDTRGTANGYNVPEAHNVTEIMDWMSNGAPYGKTAVRCSDNKTVDITGLDLSKTGSGYAYNGKGYRVGWFYIHGYSTTETGVLGDPLKATDNTNSNGLNRMVQLCYSGGTKYGASSHPVFDEMVVYCANRLAGIINNDKSGLKVLQFTAEDNGKICQCSACLSWYNHYNGGLSTYHNSTWQYEGFMGLQLRFINAVAKYITNNNLVTDPAKQDVKIAVYCYGRYTDAPCTESNGVYTPIDSQVICPDNVCIYLAPTMDYTTGIFDSSSDKNQKVLKVFKALTTLTDNIGAWLYQNVYENYYMPYNSFYGYKETYAQLKDMGCLWIFNQGGQTNTIKNTSFGDLKLYLNAELGYNTSLDTQELIDKWFKGYFGTGSADMMKYFKEVNAVCDKIGAAGIDEMSPAGFSTTYFTKSKLSTWLGYCNTAIAHIKAANIDSARKEILCNNVEVEKIAIEFMLLNLHSDYSFYSLKDLDESGKIDITDARLHFEQKSVKLGVLNAYQHTPIAIDGVVDAFWTQADFLNH